MDGLPSRDGESTQAAIDDADVKAMQALKARQRAAAPGSFGRRFLDGGDGGRPVRGRAGRPPRRAAARRRDLDKGPLAAAKHSSIFSSHHAKHLRLEDDDRTFTYACPAAHARFSSGKHDAKHVHLKNVTEVHLVDPTKPRPRWKSTLQRGFNVLRYDPLRPQFLDGRRGWTCSCRLVQE